MNPELNEALQKARKLEMDGIEFYTRAGRECSAASGTRMFESFAADERRHLKIVSDVAEGLGVDVSGQPTPRESIRTIFSEAAEKMDDYVESTADERDAVRVALGMETESYELYKDAAARASDQTTRKLMERLALEENQHYEMLNNTLEYMEANEKWWLWREGGLLTGDRSSIGME